MSDTKEGGNERLEDLPEKFRRWKDAWEIKDKDGSRAFKYCADAVENVLGNQFELGDTCPNCQEEAFMVRSINDQPNYYKSIKECIECSHKVVSEVDGDSGETTRPGRSLDTGNDQ